MMTSKAYAEAVIIHNLHEVLQRRGEILKAYNAGEAVPFIEGFKVQRKHYHGDFELGLSQLEAFERERQAAFRRIEEQSKEKTDAIRSDVVKTRLKPMTNGKPQNQDELYNSFVARANIEKVAKAAQEDYLRMNRPIVREILVDGTRFVTEIVVVRNGQKLSNELPAPTPVNIP